MAEDEGDEGQVSPPEESQRAEMGPLDPHRTDEERVDEASDESFPASDPPAISPVVGTGPPEDVEPEAGSEGEPSGKSQTGTSQSEGEQRERR